MSGEGDFVSQSADLRVELSDLISPVQRLLGSDRANVVTWEVQPIGYAAVSLADRSLFRVTGRAQDHGQTLPWTLVLKVLRPPSGEAYPSGHSRPSRPSHWGYWAAEPLAYASGLLDDLPGIAAPRCFGVTERPDGKIWLWLQEVREDVGRAWPLERYGLAARHFGRFNGAYLTGRPLPTEWWVGHERCGPRASLPAFLWHDPAALNERDETWDHPVVRRAYHTPIAERLRRLWADDDVFYAALQRLPRTLCHYDAFRPNLFARHGPAGEDQTVAIDWSYIGIGGIGEELAAMVASTLGWFEVDGGKARNLGETVFEGYLAGLRDAGWTGDAMIARLGYAISVARYAIPFSGVAMMADEVSWESARHIWGRSLDEFVCQWPQLTYFLLDMADEARQLIQELHFE